MYHWQLEELQIGSGSWRVKAVIVAIEQCNELKKALGQSERHKQHKAVSLDHAQKGLLENNWTQEESYNGKTFRYFNFWILHVSANFSQQVETGNWGNLICKYVIRQTAKENIDSFLET